MVKVKVKVRVKVKVKATPKPYPAETQKLWKAEMGFGCRGSSPSGTCVVQRKPTSTPSLAQTQNF